MGGCHSPHPQVPTGRWSLDGRALFATSTGGPHLTCTLGRTCFAHGSHSGGQSMRCPIRFLAPRRTRDPPQVVLSLDFAQTWCTTRLRPPVASTAHLIKSQIPQVCSPPSCLPFSPAHHLSAPQMAQVHPHCRASKLSSRRALLLGSDPPIWLEAAGRPFMPPARRVMSSCVCVCVHTRVHVRMRFPRRRDSMSDRSVPADALGGTPAAALVNHICTQTCHVTLGPSLACPPPRTPGPQFPMCTVKWKQNDAFTLVLHGTPGRHGSQGRGGAAGCSCH